MSLRRSLIFALFASGSVACGPSEPAQPPPAAEPPPAPAPAPAPSAAASAAPKVEAPRPAAKPIDVPAAIQAIVNGKDRGDADRKLDVGRHPGEFLAFVGVEPGWKVAELAAAGGYTTELLARAAGPKGKVYGVNNKFILEKFAAAPWKARLALPADKNVVRLDRELDDPFPADVKELDAVVVNLFYHDAYWMIGPDGVTRMNAAVFKALKPGGVYVIVDHAGRDGTGTTEVKTLHRIEEKVVKDDAAKAGFKLAGSGDFLRNPADARDWNDSPGSAGEKRGTSDRFALKFTK